MNRLINRLNNFRAVTRLLFCLGNAILVFLAVRFFGLEILTSITVGWASFCLLMIALSWITFITVEHKELCLLAKKQDESRTIIFILVLFSVCISVAGIIVLMRNTDDSLIHKQLHTAISLSGVALSWFLLHTVFTLRYAHLYYTHTSTGADTHEGGLNFPEDQEPDYLDFAYFSFVVGMTFQVSDVMVTSKRLRHLVMMHGVISFMFNTTIVALTISLISNLGK